MARKLFISAIIKNDKSTFLGLVQEKKSLLLERHGGNQNTTLHIASKYGHTELVAEIIKLCPDMVAAENINGETPLHEACRKGKADIAKLLLETNPWSASTLNKENQSAFSIACRRGHFDVVKLMLNQTWLMDIEEDRIDLTCLHDAIQRGHTHIVKVVLETRPKFASKIDKDGSVPLHYACQKGHLEITRILLEFAENHAQQFNDNGYTPLHLAAMNGEVSILLEFMSKSPTAFKLPTKEGDTVFHLAVKSNKYDAFIGMAKIFKNTNLLHQTDRYGNTVLQLAANTGCYDLADYIISETKVDINHRNHEGNTALDLFNQAGFTSETQHIADKLMKSGGNRSTEMSPFSSFIQNLIPESHRDATEHKFDVLPESMMGAENDIGNDPNNPSIALDAGSNHGVEALHHVESTIAIQNNKHELRSSMRTVLHKHKLQSQRRRKELNTLQKTCRNKQYKAYREALLNARNTIILVAILIATVTFTVGLNPPGSVYQGGDLKGQSTVGRKLAFKIFVISNSIALFTSLCIVLVLVSIITFQRKKLVKLMVITHKIMWVAVSCMATAYVAATWVILPHAHQMRWIFDAIIAISGGTLAIVFFYLGVQLVRHWTRKSKWKKERGKKTKVSAVNIDIESQASKSVADGEIQLQSMQCSNGGDNVQSDSTNSDVDSSKSFGYHTY